LVHSLFYRILQIKNRKTYRFGIEALGFKCLLLAFLALASSGSERILTVRKIHVSLDGNDGNPGSLTAPLSKVQRGAKLAQPGDTVTVHAGMVSLKEACR
jgi:hypothetical protein